MKNYALKLYKNSGKVETFRTKKKKRFLRNIRTINWGNKVVNAYLKVSYGKFLCVHGCVCNFFNDGFYESKKELLEDFRYFDEEQ
jgi:hypothetical protein